ncbi:MAG: hypothetical protein QNK23_17125 [Crocinitomicaceae bacterium]|nr:hypothetical protein [Crocinitomicaceae bacterium]
MNNLKEEEFEDQRKVDFKRHTSPPVSKWFLLKIITYVVILIVLGVLVYSLSQKTTIKDESEVVEIEGVSLEL